MRPGQSIAEFGKSKNVKQKTRDITPQQAEARRKQYAESIGLRPTNSIVALRPQSTIGPGQFPKARRNQLGYGNQFGVEHETAHAIMTPEHQTIRQYQKELSVHAGPEKIPKDTEYGGDIDYDSPQYEQHETAIHHENVANRIENMIDRRAGVSPKKFKSKFRDSVLAPAGQDDDSGEDQTESLRDDARHHINQFDQGARFTNQGRIKQPQGINAKINAKMNKALEPGQSINSLRRTFVV